MIRIFGQYLLSILTAVLKTGLVIYLLVLVVLYVFQRSLLFAAPHDVRTPEQVGASQFIGVEATSEGRRLTSWYAPPTALGQKVIVYFHGNAGSLAMVAPYMKGYTDQGFGVLLVAFRGYNGDAGKPTEDGLYQDARAALASLKQMGFGPDRVVLLGQSMGTGIAVQMATEGLGSVLVLEAPYTSMWDAAKTHYPFVPVSLLMKDHFDNLSKIAALHLPVMIVSGNVDAVIPHAQAVRLFESANQPKRSLWLADAGHNDLYEHGAQSQIIDFIRSLEKDSPHEADTP